jgi:hypothetical protein
MTQSPDQSPIPELQLEAPHGKLSDAELASFLRRLAALYRSPATGNLSLSEALNELASWVSKRVTVSKTPSTLRKQKTLGKPALDTKAVEKFINDERKTKRDLIELASARFSIPRSQLKRLRTYEVRETIKAACLHEDSIEIISQEARRDGSNRSS